jgi:predicted HTH transcriptional regulator
MKYIDEILGRLEESIRSGVYSPLENERVELKKLSTGGEWKELYKTANAFLNTEGGIIIIGIEEVQPKGDTPGRYVFHSFDRRNEEKLVQMRNRIFTDDNDKQIDLSFYFPNWEYRPLANGEVCVVYVEKLPEDEKYVLYERQAYQRKLAGDHKITPENVQEQQERRQVLRSARELMPVPGATVDDLNVDKLNEYIAIINRDVRIETLKPDIRSAMSFLKRKGFVRDDETPTLLGMFLCGNYVGDVLRGKCEVDCYVESINTAVEKFREQKIFKDNINNLIEYCHNFVFRNIRVAVTLALGGSPQPEYPDVLLREIINNAIAHRDYRSDRFSIISIVPQKHISIRNPGTFKKSLVVKADVAMPEKGLICRIRRIIPNAVAQNPRLNDILKEYNKWEGRGIGMATLTNKALENRIGVPYYILREEEIELIVPSGEVLTPEMQYWLAGFDAFLYRNMGNRSLTEEELTVMAYLYRCEQLNAEGKYTVMFNESNNHFGTLTTLENAGLIYRLHSPDISADITIYVVHRILMKKRYDTELATMFGNDYTMLSNDYKDVLCAVYQHNFFSSEQEPSANRISNYLLTRGAMTASADNFKRKIRYIVRRLEETGMIVRVNPAKPNYTLNTNYSPETTIFNG